MTKRRRSLLDLIEDKVGNEARDDYARDVLAAHDAHLARSFLPNLTMQGIRSRGRPAIAPDWDSKLLSAASSAADPFQAPSALLGLLRPDVTEAWRATSDRHPGMAIAGGLLGPAAAVGAATRSIPMARAAALGLLPTAAAETLNSIYDVAAEEAEEASASKKRKSKKPAADEEDDD